MTFLSPIPALIAAAVTVPVLLVLYFLKLRRRPIRVSSTLLWDQAVRDLQVNVPFRLIRPTWLLLLQLLILGLFLAAMARPAIDLPRGSPARVVILIDRSASMSARDGGTEPSPRTRLEEAKSRALARLDELGRSGSTFAVIAVGVEAVLVNSFSSVSAARTAIAGIEATDQPGDLRAALQLAGGLLTGDADESAGRARGLVLLFSDGSFSGEQALTLAGAEFRFERIGPTTAPQDTESDSGAAGGLTTESLDNVGFVAVAARREWDDPTTIRVFARVINASSSIVTTPVILSFNGKETETRVATIPARAKDGPGTAPVSFQLDTREGGIAAIRISREDLLAADNTASLVIAPASKPRILVVTPNAKAGEARFDWIVTNIIEELQLPMRVMSASLYAAEAAGSLRYDLVIFDGVRPGAPPPIPSLSFGAGIGELGVGSTPGHGTYFLSWNRSHPVLRHASLDGVHIARPLPLTGIAPENELAAGSDGPLIAAASGTGPRRIVTAFELSQTNWPVQVGFPIFLASAIDYLTLRGEERAGKAFSTSEPARLDRGGTGEITLEGPTRITARAGADAAAPVSLGVLERVGVYRVTGAGEDRAAVAVNLLDETESSLAVQESLRVSGQVVTGAAGDGGPREVWAWLVLAALVLLSLEWMINAWMMKV